MSTQVTVYTGGGELQATIPDEGTPAYWDSLKSVAELLKRQVEDQALHERSFYIGAPEGPNGVVIPLSSTVGYEIPAELVDGCGPGFIPFLYTRLVLEAGSLYYPAWQLVTNYSYSSATLAQVHCIGLQLDMSGSPYKLNIRNGSVAPWEVKGLLYFPKRNNATSEHRIVP